MQLPPTDATTRNVIRGQINPKWLVSFQNVTTLKRLGVGEFGEVFLGEVGPEGKRDKIAIKTLKDVSDLTHSQDKYEEIRGMFTTELQILMNLDHPRILRAFGIDMSTSTMFMALELCANGSLLEYLVENQDNVSQKERLRFIIETGEAIEYLQQKSLIHRDIAVRNCLLDENMSVKLCDFGLGLCTGGKDEVIDHWGHLPYRWLPPEACREGIYNMTSDVWGLAIMMFEVYANGFEPYTEITSRSMSIKEKENVILAFLLNENLRLKMPKNCPDNMTKIAQACWQLDPKDRPSIQTVLEELRRCDTANSFFS